MEPIFELAIDLPAKGSGDLVRSLHRQLRAAILDGRLQAGLRLPPTRTLAGRLGLSRNSVIAAYDLLLSEGYLEARAGAGTFVAHVRPRAAPPQPSRGPRGTDPRIASFWRTDKVTSRWPILRDGRYDFRTGYPDAALFPFEIWQRLATRAARAYARQRGIAIELQGLPRLRQAIAGHVSFARAVACSPDDIVVTTGTRQAVDLIARTLVTPGETQVVIEDPCYPPLRWVFAAAGARIHSVPVDREGLQVDKMPRDARIVCVAPSHQYPLGVVLSARRRAALLERAETSGAVVIEDDYDSEFRFRGRPLDALQTLDRKGSVFYIGTFGKSMFSAVRTGFIVAPPWARHALVAAKLTVDGTNPAIHQDTLAAFIAEGHLARHIRKMRKVYGERQRVLIEAIARHCGDWLKPIVSDAGVHLAAELDGPLTAEELAVAAGHAGISVETLDNYAHRTGAQTGLLFGYGRIGADEIPVAIRALARVMRQARPPAASA